MASKKTSAPLRPLTSRQFTALRAIEWFQTHHQGRSPTQGELSRMLRLRSTQGCRPLLEALEQRGYITRTKNRWRAIRVLHPSQEATVLKPVR